MMDLPDDKLRECKEAFDMFDKDKDGFLSSEEFKYSLLCLGIDLDDDVLTETMNEYNEDLTICKISYSNFLSVISKRSREYDLEDEIMEAFKSFDKEGNGKIGVKELNYLLLSIGESFNQEELFEFISEVDTTGQGVITYKDFVRLMLTK